MAHSSNHAFSAQVSDTVTDVDGTAPVAVKTLVVANTTVAAAYLQIFGKAASDVTLGTTVPNHVIPILGTGGIALNFGEGWFVGGTAMSVACTTTRTGSTAAAMDIFLTY